MIMNWSSKALVLIVVSAFFLEAFVTETRNNREAESDLQLAVRIVNSEYCRADSELDSLRLKLKLTFTNRKKEPLILYRGTSLVSRIMISRNFADAAAKRFEVDSLLTPLTSGARKCYKGAAPTSCFVVLPPDASFETEAVAGVFAVRGDVRDIVGAVKSGDHLLQIEVITWHESDELAKNLRARWLPHGLLWYEPITSAPMQFRVERDRTSASCP